MLRRLGYEADIVANGLEVLQALEERHYGAMLIDILLHKVQVLER